MAATPIREFKSSRNAKIAVWDNGNKGYSASIQMPQYQEDGEWKSSKSLFVQDMPGLIHALITALAWMEGAEERLKSGS